MKQLIHYRIYDLVAQLVCALLPMTIFWCTNDGSMLVCTYLAVGLCDILSYVANNTEEDKPHHVYARKIYGKTWKIILIVGVVSVIAVFSPVTAPITPGYLYLMFYLWPLMAVFYFIISIAELRKLIVAQSRLNK